MEKNLDDFSDIVSTFSYMQRKLQSYLNSEFREYNLKSSELMPLKILQKKELTQTEISKVVKCDKAHISRIISRLLASGLIEFSSGYQGKNSKLKLTEQGKITSMKIEKYLKSFENTLFAGIEKKDIETAQKVISKFIKNAEKIKNGENND